MIKEDKEFKAPKTLEDYLKEINLFYRSVTSRESNQESVNDLIVEEDEPSDDPLNEELPPPPEPPFDMPSNPEMEYINLQKDNESRGKIKVQTFMGRKTFPVPNVEIIISKVFDSGKYDIYNTITDESGQTREFEVPATPKIETENPDTEVNFVTYRVEAKHPDFVTVIYESIPVFEGRTSIQNVNMIMRSVSPNPGKPIVFDEEDKYFL